MKAYREWLPADGYEAKASIGGSFFSDNIEDYYLTPWDLGYGRFVKFDHDFIGREALEKMAGRAASQEGDAGARRTRMSTRVVGTQVPARATRAKFMEFPSAVYSMHPYDKVTKDGKTVGVSTWVGYSANEGKMLTLAMLDAEHAEPGTEVTFVWGEENGGTASRRSSATRADAACGPIVSPVPYVEVVRKGYAPGGWRAAHA